MRDAPGNTRHRRISCAASSGQRNTSSMREALYSTTSAQHGTDATHEMQHTTFSAAACSKHTWKYTGYDERSPEARAPRGSVGLAGCAGPWARPHSSLSAKVESSLDKLAVRADYGEPMRAPSLRRLPEVSLASVSLSACIPLCLGVWDIGFRGVGMQLTGGGKG